MAHLDDRPDSPAPLSWFQANGHWTKPSQIASEMGAAGYQSTGRFDFLAGQSFQIFAPGSVTAEAKGASQGSVAPPP